jgi:hypothetical protein
MIKLDTVESAFGTITVFKKKSTSTIAYEQGGCLQAKQTAMVLASPRTFTQSSALFSN